MTGPRTRVSRSRRGLLAGAGAATVAAAASVTRPAGAQEPTTSHAKDARHIRTFGVVGDGVADDTAAVQTAIATAIGDQIELYSDPGVSLLVDPIVVDGALVLSGHWTFIARTTDQDTVLTVSGRLDWARASVTVNAAYRARYGIRAADFGRSRFGVVRVERCQVWGWQFEASGNNNLVTVERLAAKICGNRVSVTLTETAETDNVDSSVSGFGTFAVSPSLPANALLSDAVHFVIANDTPYKVKSVTATSIEVHNLRAPAGVGDTISADVIIGGGLNIVAHGDNGVGRWGSLDISACGVAIQQNSLYGHQFDNLVCQENALGYTCATYTLETVLTKPYFEGNVRDIVSQLYVKGAVIAPVMGLSKVFNILHSLSGNPHMDPGLAIVKDRMPGIHTDVPPKANPGSRTLRPGQHYHFHRSGSGSWTFEIDNAMEYAAIGAFGIQIDLSHDPGVVGHLTLTLATANGDTIEGTTTFDTNVSGRTTVRLWRVGTDWRIQVTTDRQAADSIATAPEYVGQLAVAGGVGHLAVGTASPSDWKAIT